MRINPTDWHCIVFGIEARDEWLWYWHLLLKSNVYDTRSREGYRYSSRVDANSCVFRNNLKGEASKSSYSFPFPLSTFQFPKAQGLYRIWNNIKSRRYSRQSVSGKVESLFTVLVLLGCNVEPTTITISKDEMFHNSQNLLPTGYNLLVGEASKYTGSFDLTWAVDSVRLASLTRAQAIWCYIYVPYL